MNWQTILHDLRPEILLRLALAIAAGFFIGRERESHGRAAGLRTTLLVCLSSAVAMIVSDAFYHESFSKQGPASWHPDPARLAAGILAGMGFLGAGVIVHERTNVVHGVTTAATLWFSAIIGLAIGAGALTLGVASAVLALVILRWIPRFENRMDNDWYSDLSIRFGAESVSVDEVTTVLEKLGIKITGMAWHEDLEARESTLLFHVKYKKSELLTLPARAVGAFKNLTDVKNIHWK